MTEQDLEFWGKAVDARQELIDQYTAHPGVTRIDIGYPPQACKNVDQVVLRVHVTEAWFATEEHTAVQQAVDGIPVCVIYKDG